MPQRTVPEDIGGLSLHLPGVVMGSRGLLPHAGPVRLETRSHAAMPDQDTLFSEQLAYAQRPLPTSFQLLSVLLAARIA